LAERTATEEANAEQGLLAAIVDSSDDAIVSKSLAGTIRSWNAGAERLFGYSAAEAIGQSILLIIPPERAGEEDEILARVRAGERIGHVETVRIAKDGRRIDVSLTISPIHDASGRAIGTSTVARDITLEKRAREVLREADRTKDEFLAILAHELRNRLAPIRNALEVLSAGSQIAPEAKPLMDLIDRQTTQMIRLVNDLMDVSRISRNELKLRKKRVKLQDVLRDAFEVSRPLIDEREQVLSVSEPPRAIYVEVDRVRMAQAVSNLLNNAARYTPNGGRIELRAERRGDEAIVTVTDNGAGIAPELLPQLFEMFVRADPSHDGPQRGLGVGLTLVKRIMELHGGSIEARSEGRGKGSEFAVRVPLAKGRPRQRAPSAESATPLAARRILLVDDDRDLANSLAMALTALGHEVRMAHDGPDAVELAKAFRPHVITVDVSLPTMNGFEVAAALRRHAWAREIVLIAVTGWDESEARERAREAGFDHYVVKPIGAVDLAKLFEARSA
jgi:two-component system, chemotaxis family, CheB/CheR fusion protein